jgi:hypothetical protein
MSTELGAETASDACAATISGRGDCELATPHPLPARSAPEMRDHRSRACWPGSRSATSASARPGTGASARPDRAPPQARRIVGRRQNDGHAVMNVGDQFIGVRMMIAKARSHAPDAGSFQFSQTPARPKAARSFIAMAQSRLAFCPPSTRRSRPPAGRSAACGRPPGRSAGPAQSRTWRLAPPFGSLHQYGIRLQRNGSSKTSQ